MKQKKSRRSVSTILMYGGAAVVALIGTAFLVDNIILFKTTVAQYVAQGYTSAEVVKGLLPGQLLPGIFEPIGIYGGVAFILFSAGIINQRVLNLNTLAEIKADSADIDTTQQKAVEEISEAANETQQ